MLNLTTRSPGPAPGPSALNLPLWQKTGCGDVPHSKTPRLTALSLLCSAEPSSGSHGTQVNVTCIVNVCSNSGHGSQCPSQTSSTAGDTDASPSDSLKDEQVPFSKEECPCQSQSGASETLLQNPEEKPLPLGVPEGGVKSLTRPARDASQPRGADLWAF